MASTNQALVQSILSRLETGPKDVGLHRLVLEDFFQYKLIDHAYDHIFHLEYEEKTFINNYGWYEMLNEFFKRHNTKDWLCQSLILTVKERMCMLSISNVPRVTFKSFTETSELFHAYDKAIGVAAIILSRRDGNHLFHAKLIGHHRVQIAFLAALLLLKKAKNIQIDWHDAIKFTAPLMLIVWTKKIPSEYFIANRTQGIAASRLSTEYYVLRCQAEIYLLENKQLIKHIFVEGSPCFSDTNWREELYKTLFTNESHLDQIKTSSLTSDALDAPELEFPRKDRVYISHSIDWDEYGNSLHHLVWIVMIYENYAHFNLLHYYFVPTGIAFCGLNQLDMYAFLYCAALTARQKKPTGLTESERPILLPVNITDLLCSEAQAEWWGWAYKFTQNKNTSDCTEDHALQMRGIEVVRCIGEHGLDPELLCSLGRIFSDRSKLEKNEEFKLQLEKRAALYYSTAIPLLKKLKSKMPVEIPENRLFDYTHKNLSTEQLNGLLEECRLFVADYNFNDGEHDKDDEILSNNKSPQDNYQTQDNKKIGTDENSSSSDVESKSKFEALDTLDDSNSEGLHSDTEHLIEDIEKGLDKVNPEVDPLEDVEDDASTVSNSNIDNTTIKDFMEQTKQWFEENRKLVNLIISTVDSNMQNTTEQFKHLNISVDNVKDQIDDCRNECKDVGEIKKQIALLTEQVSKQNTTDQLKHLKISVDHVKDEIDDCRNEFKDVGEIKKQIALLTEQVSEQNTTDQFKHLNISVDHVKDQIDDCRNECKDVSEIKKQIALLTEQVREQNTTDQFKHLNISVDHVKDQIDECRNECKDVGEIKEQIALLTEQVSEQNTTDQFKHLKISVDNVKDQIDDCRNEFKDVGEIKKQIALLTEQVSEQNTTDQFKHLNISVDNVKDQIDDCRNECKDVGEIKKQIALLTEQVSEQNTTDQLKHLNISVDHVKDQIDGCRNECKDVGEIKEQIALLTEQVSEQNTTDQFKLLKISVDHLKDQIDECRNECKDVGEIKEQIALLTEQVSKQNTTDQFKLLNISVDNVKDQIDECRNDCKDVGEIKKLIALLTKQVSKLEKAASAGSACQDSGDASNKNSSTSMPSTNETNMTSPPVFAAPAQTPPANLNTSDTQFEPNAEFKPVNTNKSKSKFWCCFQGKTNP